MNLRALYLLRETSLRMDKMNLGSSSRRRTEERRETQREHLLSLPPELPFGPQINYPIQVVKFSYF